MRRIRSVSTHGIGSVAWRRARDRSLRGRMRHQGCIQLSCGSCRSLENRIKEGVRQTGDSRIPAPAICIVAFQGEKYVRQTLSDCSGRRKWRRGCLSDGDGGEGERDILTPHRVRAEVCGGAAEARHVEGETSAPDCCHSTSGAARWPVWWGGAPESSPAPGSVLTPATSRRWYNSSIRACGRPQGGGSCPWRR